MKVALLILFTFFESLQANGLGFLGCCGGPGPGPYPAGTMTPSGYPIYGMAPHASDAVAYSSPGSSYGYGSSGGGYGSSGYGASGGYGGGYGSGGYGSSGGYSGGYGAPLSGGGSYGGSESSGGGGIDFDSIPYGSAPPGSQPIAIRYFKEAIPVDIDPARLRPLGPTQLIRMPIYGISRSHQTEYSPSPYPQTSSMYQPTPNLYRPAMGGGEYTSKYNKFAHPVESDIARGYQPAYSNWNRQPMQAVFRQSEAPLSMGGSSMGSGGGQSSSSYSSSGSDNIAPVRPAPAESSGFSEMSHGSSGSDFSGSGHHEHGGGGSSGLEISHSHGSGSGSGSSQPFPGGSGAEEPSSGSASKGSSGFPDVRSEVQTSGGLSKTGFPDLQGSNSNNEQAFPDIAAPPPGKTSGSISNSGNAFPDISKGGKAGSFQTADAALPARARAAAATSSATNPQTSELKPVHLQNLPRKSTGAENYKLSGEVLETVNALLLEREKLAH